MPSNLNYTRLYSEENNKFNFLSDFQTEKEAKAHLKIIHVK